MKKTIFFIAILASLITSCNREDIIEVRYLQDKKLAIYSLVSPQSDSIFVFLKPVIYDLNALYSTNTELPKGKVTLSSNEKEIDLTLLNSNPTTYGCSQLDLPIKQGISYSIFVNLPDYNPIFAETTVPYVFAKWENPIHPYRKILKKPTHYYKAFVFEADIPALPYIYFDYIQYAEIYRHNSIQFDSLGNFYTVPGGTDTIIHNSSKERIFNLDINPTVTQTPNGYHVQIAFSNGITNENDDYFMVPTYSSMEITYIVFTVDQNYSDYIQLQKQYKDPPWTEAMPIEPQIDYVLPSFSNVEGGYGLFGSYVYDSIHYDLRNYQDFHENN